MYKEALAFFKSKQLASFELKLICAPGLFTTYKQQFSEKKTLKKLAQKTDMNEPI